MPGDVTRRKQEPENRFDRFVSTLEWHQNSDENEEPLLFLIHLDVNLCWGPIMCVLFCIARYARLG
jgi:hypothetical protein